MNLPVSVEALWPLALLAAIPAVVWLGARGRTRLPRRHQRVVTVLRSLALACVALALMRPHWNGGSVEVSVVYALDVSGSISPSFIESSLRWIDQADREGKPAHARYVAFADRAVMLDDAAEIRALTLVNGGVAGAARRGSLDRAATNLERALGTAVLGLDPSQAMRVVLFSDGNQTAGDVWRMLPALEQSRVRVFTVPAASGSVRDAWLAGIDVPGDVRAGEPVGVIVRIVASTAMRAKVALKSGLVPIGTKAVRLVPGPNRVAFEARIARPGETVFSAEVVAEGDTVSANNRAHRTLWVEPRTRVLLVAGGAPDAARYLPAALAQQGIDAQVVAPEGIPAAALAGFDAIVLSDVPAKALPDESMRAIQSYVRDQGGGLLFAGGENVHGEQGYADSPVEKTLPVQFEAQEKRKDLAMVVALDRSYSMKGRKMEMAKEATRAALDLLEEQHRFAVVAFDSQTYIAVPMQFVRSRRKAEDQIGRIQASGQTNIYPALGITYRMLQKVDSKAKHVILLSDGDTHPADFETLVKRMAAEKIVVSTVAVGADADRALMSDIARWGKGRAYVAESADAIPQIFIEETERAVRTNLLEESFRPVVKRRGAALRGLDADALPELRGLVSSKAREHAEVILATPSSAPLLARWQYGLGTAVAFTSDVGNRWAPEWIKWSGYGRFWAQQLRDLMRRETSEALDFRVGREASDAVIRLSALAADGTFRSGMSPRVRVMRADGASTLVGLAQVGAGHYEARVPIERVAGPARFELVEAVGLSSRTLRRAGIRELHEDFPDEYRSLPPDLDLLDALARATGGRTNPPVAEVFAPHGDNGTASRGLWPWLACLGLLLYLLDVAARRSPWVWRAMGS